ncbi:MAG TPA: glutaredoxin family protein [Thermoanaerobaculia bacterium]|nr:glutaredoxin family protein [Thermoanaerobaculia bacterium]
MARYELVTRAGCHLCHEMAALLDEVLPTYGLTWQPVDVDGNPTLRLRYGEAVPVLLRDGKPVAKVRVDRRTLERIAIGRR